MVILRFLALPILLLALCSECFGEAKAIIVGPEKSAPGDLIILDGSTSTADAFKWTLANSTKTFLATDGGKKCVFASGQEGTYIFLLSVASCDKDSPATVSVATHVLTIGDNPNPPGPGPKPPDPPTPDNLTETGKKVREWASAVGNKVEAKQIGENYSAIVSAIAAGAYKGLDFADARSKIVSDVYQLNQKVSANNEEWGAFFRNLSDHFKVLDAEGKLDSVDKIKTLFEEIQAGLEAAQ